MSATLSAGVNSLILKLDTPYDTIRTSDVRDDLVKVKVWCSATSGFTPIDTGTAGANQVFDGLSLSIVISKLADGTALAAGTPYYVKYAFISDIDEAVYTVSSQITATPVSAPAGDSVRIVFIRSASQPTTPTASPDTPTDPDIWYSNTNTVPSSTDPLWASTGTKASGQTNYTWQVPVRVEGTAGTNGNSISIVFRRSPLQPTTPTASASTPTAPDTWYPSTDDVPASSNPMWSSVGTKLSTETVYTWQLPVRVEGDVGVAGDSARIAYLTQSQSASDPVISPTTTTGTSSLPAGWSGTITPPGAGQSLWASDGVYNTPSDTVTWSTPYLTQGFPTTIQSDNYNATTAGWQIQRNTGNAYFNNVTARGSLISGTAGQQRIEINVASSNRIEAFRSDNVRFLSLGGSGGTTVDTAVIGISANANIINPVIVESSATTGSGIHSNTLSTANAISSVSTGGGRLFYGSITSGSNPDAAIRVDVDSAGHNGAGIKMLMGSSTGPAFYAGGSGDAYAFDGVTGSFGTGKSGVGFFKAIDLPTNTSTITTAGTAAQLVFDGTGIDLSSPTLGPLTFVITLEGTLYQTILEYDSETLYNINQWAIALQASIDNSWRVTSTGTLASNPVFKITKTTIGAVTSTSGTVTINSIPYAATFSNGSDNVYSSGYKVIRLLPFPDDSTRVLRGDGTWGTVAGSGGYVDLRYNVRDYGAKGDGSTNDTSAIQAAIDAAKVTGGTVYFPRGLYIITSSLTYTSVSTDPGARVHFAGDGIGASGIKQTGTGNGLTISGYTATTVNPNIYTHIYGLSFIGSTSGQGVAINDGAYAYIEACQFTGWAYGFYGSDFLASTFVSCQFRFNQRGFLFERIGGSYASSPNAVTMVNCEIGANSLYGGWVLGPGVFTMQGGAIEGNGTTNGSTSNWGLRISEPSGSTAIESAVGISIDGVYFEANIGLADLWISSSATKPGVTNNINGCSFVRTGSSYVTNNILLDSTAGNGFNNFISGCGFKSMGGYSPSAGRKTIVNGNNKVQLLGCSFDSSTDAYVPNDVNVFENPIRIPSFTDLNGTSFTYASNPAAAGIASAGSSTLFAAGDHVHPFSVTTAAASGSGGLEYTAGVLTYTPPVLSSVTVNSGTANQLSYYSTSTGISGTTLLTYQDSSLYGNKGGVTDIRLTHNLPGVTAPGVSSTGGAIALASGFNNTTGAYTAGILVTNLVDSSASFSGSVGGNTSGNAAMNLGTSVAPWNKFYWGTNSTGIAAPAGSTSTFLRNDGTWATPFGSTITVSGIITGSELTSSNSTGDEGGQVNLAKATTNTTLTDGVTIDVYQNKLRIFEKGGTNRGVYIDLSAASAGVGTNLVGGGSAGVTSITGTAPVTASASTGAVTISMAAATATVNGYMTSTYAAKLDGIAAGATANTGTVTSVALTVPTGLTVSGSPVTTSGTIAVTLTSGYSIPTTASQTNWDTAYTDRNKWDGGSTGLTASTGRTSLGATTVGSNLFTLTNPSAISFIRLNADNTVSTLDASTFRTAIGVGTINSATTNQLAYYSASTGLSGSTVLTFEDSSLYSNKAGTTDVRVTHNLPGVTAPGMSTTGSNIALAAGFNNTTGAYTAGILLAGGNLTDTNGTTTGPSFSSTKSGTVSGTATTNLGTHIAPWNKFYWGTNSTGIAAPAGSTSTFLRNDGTWATPAFVSSVGVSVPTGLTVSGSPVTSSGTIAITFTSGYSIPTTSSQTNWDTAYTDRNKWDGGSTGLAAATGRASLGGTTVGQSFFTLANPGAVTFPRMNVDNTVSALTASQLATAIGAPTYTAGTGISISSNSISLNSALAANTTVFTNNQVIGGVTVGTTASIGGFQAKNELNAGFFTKTLNAINGGLVGLYLSTTQDVNEVVTTSAFKHTSSSGARPDLGENSTAGRWGKIWATTADFSGAVATGTLSVTGSITASSSITATGDITAFSDAKLKTNIKVIAEPFKAMQDVYGSTYDRIDTGESGMGFIAQKFQKHYPDIVKETEDGTLSLKYLNIIAILWEQNRELNTRLKALEDKYDATRIS